MGAFGRLWFWWHCAHISHLTRTDHNQLTFIKCIVNVSLTLSKYWQPWVHLKLLEIIDRVRLYPLCKIIATALDSDINQTTGSGGHLSMWENRCTCIADSVSGCIATASRGSISISAQRNSVNWLRSILIWVSRRPNRRIWRGYDSKWKNLDWI